MGVSSIPLGLSTCPTRIQRGRHKKRGNAFGATSRIGRPSAEPPRLLDGAFLDICQELRYTVTARTIDYIALPQCPESGGLVRRDPLREVNASGGFQPLAGRPLVLGMGLGWHRRCPGGVTLYRALA